MARFVNAQVPEVVQPFWAALQRGEFIADAAVQARHVPQAGHTLGGGLRRRAPAPRPQPQGPLPVVRRARGEALGGVAAGFVVGLLVPSSRVEDDKLGPLADQVKDQVKETGQEAFDRGKEVAQQAASSAKETAQEAGREHAEGLRGSAQERAQTVSSR